MNDAEHRATEVAPTTACASRYAVLAECPLCATVLTPEHAHQRCRTCGWRDSCCD
ncbi:MAG TPA: hypothetical protein VND83_04300 [Acidimicrobiales bacterium]|nr:hypothetical protein [Acidimicrobiales bacterium]